MLKVMMSLLLAPMTTMMMLLMLGEVVLTDASGARAPFSLCEPSPRMSMYTDDRFGDPRGLLDRPSPAVHARRLTGEILTHLNKARVAGSARPLPPQSQCCQCSRAMAQEMKILPIPTLRLGGRGAAEMTSPCLRRRRPLPLHPFQNFTNTITNTTIIININIFIIIALHKQPHTHTKFSISGATRSVQEQRRPELAHRACAPLPSSRNNGEGRCWEKRRSNK